MNNEEYEQILNELDNQLPPKVYDIEDMSEYCKTITSRLLSHPPIPTDMLLLHDAVFLEGEHVAPNTKFEKSIDLNLIPPKIVPYGEWGKNAKI